MQMLAVRSQYLWCAFSPHASVKASLALMIAGMQEGDGMLLLPLHLDSLTMLLDAACEFLPGGCVHACVVNTFMIYWLGLHCCLHMSMSIYLCMKVRNQIAGCATNRLIQLIGDRLCLYDALSVRPCIAQSRKRQNAGFRDWGHSAIKTALCKVSQQTTSKNRALNDMAFHQSA